MKLRPKLLFFKLVRFFRTVFSPKFFLQSEMNWFFLRLFSSSLYQEEIDHWNRKKSQQQKKKIDNCKLEMKEVE